MWNEIPVEGVLAVVVISPTASALIRWRGTQELSLSSRASHVQTVLRLHAYVLGPGSPFSLRAGPPGPAGRRETRGSSTWEWAWAVL